LPEVGRSLGRSIVEFKRGVKGIQDEIDTESRKPTAQIEPPKDAAGRDARFGHGDHVEVAEKPATSES
jgi:sec-independent protein translocase protein TatA